MARNSFLSPDILRKIKQIEIKTKRLLSGSLVGDFRAVHKGTGFEFDQIRSYQIGDDVRFIDWNASARANKMLIKEYREERSRTVLLAVDVSGSTFFASTEQKKHDLMAQVASVLALVADCSNDAVGLILFSDVVELYIPPRRGKSHVHGIMNQLFGYKPQRTGTAFDQLLKELAKTKRNDVLLFLISDFIGQLRESYVPVVTKHYDVIAVRCLDKNEQFFPVAGFLTIADIETGQKTMIDLRKHNKQAIAEFLGQRTRAQNNLFKRYGIEVLDVTSGRPFVGDIISFFRRRMG